MSVIAILSDIHGNLPAFEAVLRDVEQTPAEEFLFGGDIIGYGAAPQPCVELARKLGGRGVMGNHEYYSKLIAVKGIENFGEDWPDNPVLAGVVHALRTLSVDEINWAWDLPMSLTPNEDTILAHAGLEDLMAWPYLKDLDAAGPSLKIMKEKGHTVGFFGHVHRFGIFPLLAYNSKGDIYELPDDSATAIVVGSVGQSREILDNRACWVLWDTAARTVQFRKVEYDWKKAAQAILDANLPAYSATRLSDLSDLNDDEL
jgi:diadenosine tetraphosphatase ApaH/serine/threonine PP2A family protein phosphatase